MSVRIQNIEERLFEVDRVIISTSTDGCRLIERGAPVSEVDNIVGFLQELYKRRESILWELKKTGSTATEAYAHFRARKEGHVELYNSMGNGKVR